MAADADSRKDALVEEIKASARDAKERNEKERLQLEKDHEVLESQKKEVKE